MKRLLITGASGFIGRNLKESAFLNDNFDIVTPTHEELDLADSLSVDRYFKGADSFDYVIHSATKPGHRNAKDHSKLFYTNVRMFENLAKHENAFKRVLNFGSGAIYDLAFDISNAKEEDRFKNIGADEHGFCKYVVGKRIETLNNFIDLNIFGIFGKYEDYAIRFISNAICKALYSLPITLRQDRRFSYLDVDDLPLICFLLLTREVKYKSYNVVPDGYIRLKVIAEQIKDMLGAELKVANDGLGLDYFGSNERLKKEFPEIKFTSFSDSLSRLVDYYKQNLNTVQYNLLLEDK